MSEHSDVVVIGAGMAGVTAGRELAAAGLDVVVLEAQDRVGGRVHTDRDFCELPVERGAEFIHTAEAPTLAEVAAANLEIMQLNPADGFMMSYGGVRTPQLFDDPSFAKLGDLLGDMRRVGDPDQTAAAFLAAREVEGPARAMADQILSVHPLGNLDQLSMQGLRDDHVVDLEVGVDHRVLAGYDALPQWIGRDLDVRTGVRVHRIDWSADGARVTAADGATFAARAAVCTLPVGILKAGVVHFAPDLPVAKWRALNGLEMGAVLKVLMRFDEPFWPDDLMMFACDGPIRLYWTPLYGRADTPAVLTAYVGGHRARALSAMTEADAIAATVSDLDRVFPEARPSQLLRDARLVDWCINPNTLGGYSFVRFGGAGARAALAASDTGALFWAGDGTATEGIAAVVHAAYGTGKRAAREVCALLEG